jgi:glycosyltransferase involved in cell wall biosynthesis
LLAKKLLRLKAPVIYTFHEGEISSKYAGGNIFKAILASRRWKIAFIKHINLVITRNLEIMGNCKNVPVIEVPSPVDVEIFKPLDKAECRSRLSIEMDKPIIFFPAGPAVPGKNFIFLKEVVAELNKDRKQKLEMFTGPILPEKMPLYYNACDVVCLPSLYEASPVVIREAMACNRPIVASDVGDIGKTIGNVDGCFVVRDWNKNDFGECILKALQYESTKGRERILEMGWDSETSAKKLLSALNQLTHSVKPRGRKAQ